MNWKAAVVLVGLGLGCTDRDIFKQPGLGAGPVDNKLAIQSSFCTEDPTRVEFPVKILFAVDTSQSMIQTDPAGRRLTAVQEVVDAYINDPGVSFAIIAFASASNVLTNNPVTREPGFTRDRMELDTAIVRLGLAEQPTNYEGAIDQIFTVLARDMQGSDELTLARSKYVIIFISDGLPNPVRPPSNTRESIIDSIEEIQNLKRIYQPAEIRFHTGLLLSARGTGSRCTDRDLQGGDANCPTAPDAATCRTLVDNTNRATCIWIGVEQEAESLLTAMAQAGNGTFRNFPNGEEINFLKIDFTSIRRVFTLKNLLVSNTNSRPSLTFVNEKDKIGRATPDSDGDGISDAEEVAFGTEVENRDTDNDGFSDLLEVRLAASGFDPLDPSDADCALAQDRRDVDGDGLRDCEERFVGTNRTVIDSDADGFPDIIELKSETNPVTDDSRADLDFDSARNADEIRGNSEALINDAKDRSSIAYRYDLKSRSLDDLPLGDPRIQIVGQGRACYDFRVENITLAATVSGRNRIYIYVDQAPFDDPTDFGVFRIACIEQTYLYPDFRDPPYPEVVFTEDAFHPLTNFDPDRDCITGVPPATED